MPSPTAKALLPQPTYSISPPSTLPTPASATSTGGSSLLNSSNRVSSPDEGTTTRGRSDSVQKTLLQVTTDNEQFAVVDITGLSSSEGIRERIFSRVSWFIWKDLTLQLRFRDNDHPSLSIYRTDIGEQPDSLPLTYQALQHLCQTQGDSRATLKFLVIQTGVPSSTSASVVPPNAPHVESAGYRARAGVPPIVTNMPAPPYSPPNGPSNNSSLSSAGEAMERGQGSRSSIGDTWHDDGHRWAAPRSPGMDQLGHPPAFASSSQHLHLPTQTGSTSTSSLLLPGHDDEGTYRAGSSSAAASSSSQGFGLSYANGSGSGSNQAGGSSSVGDLGMENIDLSGMDMETRKLVLQMLHEEQTEWQQQEEELVLADERLAMHEQEIERRKEEAARRRAEAARAESVRADELVALAAQADEREAWQRSTQVSEDHDAQIHGDEAQAVSVVGPPVLTPAAVRCGGAAVGRGTPSARPRTQPPNERLDVHARVVILHLSPTAATVSEFMGYSGPVRVVGSARPQPVCAGSTGASAEVPQHGPDA